MRPWARWFSSWGSGKGMDPSLGLTDENGKFVWESAPRGEGHVFRRHVYETMRYRTHQNAETAGENASPPG